MGGGIASIISSLFNSEQFSDVEFVFDDDSGHSYYGHKLILSLRSGYFASKYYEKVKNEETTLRIKLPSSIKSIIFAMLRFIYTDEIKFNSVTEAESILAIAERFEVDELKSKCLSHFVSDPITIHNIFTKYDCALRNHIEPLLNRCQEFAVRNSELVIKSTDFNDAPMDVVEDIIKQEDLSISSELVIIDAVLKWGKERCKKDKSYFDDNMLKQYIQPLLKHVRFLTLTDDEFQSVLINYNIFNPYESHCLTRKILQPEKQYDVPEYICKSEIKRNALKCAKAMYGARQSSVPENSETFLGRNLVTKSSSHDSNKTQTQPSYIQPSYNYFTNLDEKKDDKLIRHSTNISNGSQSPDTLSILKETKLINLDFVADLKCFEVNRDLFNSTEKKLPSNNEVASSSNDSKINMKSSTLQQRMPLQNKDKSVSPNAQELMNALSPTNYSPDMNAFFKKSNVSSNNSSQIGPLHSMNDTITQKSYRSTESSVLKPNDRKLSYEFRQPSVFPKQNDRSSKFTSSPSLFASSSVTNTFDFPLSSNTPSLQSSFPRDLKCDVFFKMIRGHIQLRSLELYIKKIHEKEIIEGDIDFISFYPNNNMQFKNELKNNSLTVLFPKPVLLKEGNKGVLTVSIDSLCIDRCQIITPNFNDVELNNGSNFKCEISIKSSQPKSDPNGMPFLIKRLTYTPYK